MLTINTDPRSMTDEFIAEMGMTATYYGDETRQGLRDCLGAILDSAVSLAENESVVAEFERPLNELCLKEAWEAYRAYEKAVAMDSTNMLEAIFAAGLKGQEVVLVNLPEQEALRQAFVDLVAGDGTILMAFEALQGARLAEFTALQTAVRTAAKQTRIAFKTILNL